MSYSVDQHLFGPTAYRKARAVAMPSSGFYAPRRRLTCSQPSSFHLDTTNDDMTRRTEQEILQTLNDRFAGYIDKVRYLEMHNRNLEAEAEALRQNQAGRASVDEQYERELEELRALLVQLTGEKAGLALEHDHLEDSIQQLTARLEDELRNREELEAAARAMKKYVEECRLARLELDRKMRGLEEEESFLKKNHEEEVSELLAQIQGAQISFDLRSVQRADITGALREIRAELDSHAIESSTQAEEWFKVRVEHLSDAARSNQHALNKRQEEIGDHRRQLQNRTTELETLRGAKESLERQRVECEERNHDEVNSLQETINQLDHELKTTKWEMANQLRDYQELLNVKMALDIEIAAYRKLLEGEENRVVSGGGPYSYPLHRISSPFKLKGEEISDTVIVEEQTDETQVTEVTEEAEEEEEENQEEGKEGGAFEEAGGGEDENRAENKEEKLKYSEKPESPPSKSPQPKSSAANSPESKSPEVKFPAEDGSKSPVPKSPDSESHLPRTPEPRAPEKEKASVTDLPRELKIEDSSQLVKDEKNENEKEPNKQDPEKIDTPDPKKENTPANASKPYDTLNTAEDKPAPKSKPNDSEGKETSFAPAPDNTQLKVEAEGKPTAKEEPETKPASKEESETKPAAKEESDKKPAAKEEPETKPAAKEEPETKPVAKEEPETKPAAKEEPETKPAAKEEPETKPAAKEEPETKPAAKEEPETKPAAKEEPETKPAAKEEPETKPAAKEEPETKPAAKEESETKPAGKEESQTKPAAKEESNKKPETKPESGTKPAAKEKPETKPAAKEEPEVNPNSKAGADVKPSPKVESQKIDDKMENQKPKESEKAKPEQTDSLKEKKKDTAIDVSKEAEKAEKSSGTESKEFKEEKTSK